MYIRLDPLLLSFSYFLFFQLPIVDKMQHAQCVLVNNRSIHVDHSCTLRSMQSFGLIRFQNETTNIYYCRIVHRKHHNSPIDFVRNPPNNTFRCIQNIFLDFLHSHCKIDHNIQMQRTNGSQHKTACHNRFPNQRKLQT